MRFGLYVNPQTPGPAHDKRVIDEVLGQVELAERLGFEDCWLTEHHFSGYNAYSDPVLLAAAVSQRAPSLRIGFSLAIAPLHHPIRFVTQMHLLDQLTNGKFVVGIGPGNAEDEYRGFGNAASDRHEMIMEFVNVMESAWNAPPEGFAYHGKHWSGSVKGRIIPATVQKPGLPVAWGTNTLDTIELAGRKGWSWLIAPYHTHETLPAYLYRYTKGMNEGNLTPEQRARAWSGTGYMRQIYCAAPGENWRETIAEYIDAYARSSLLANFGIDNMPKDDFIKRRDFFVDKWLYAGAAEELIEKLTPYARLPIGHFMGWFTFGYLPDTLVRASLARFAATVMPALRAISPDWDLLNELVAIGERNPVPVRAR